MRSFPVLSALVNSHSSLSYSTLTVLQHFCRYYATKNKDVFSLIRWNAENKILYGAKRKDDTKTKVSRKAAADDKPSSLQERSYSTGGKKAKRKKSATDEGKQYVHSKPEYSTLLYNNDKEEDFDDDFLNSASQFDNTFKTGAVEERLMKMQLKFEDDFTEVSKSKLYNVSISSILPVPGSESWPAVERSERPAFSNQALKPTERAKTHTSNTLEKNEDELSSVQSAVLNFVLQFPLFPGNLNAQQRLSSQADEFKDIVEACKLRFLPTVNVVLNKTRSDLGNFFLQRWREKMIKEMGEAGFKKHQEEVIWQGTNFHACLQQYLSGVPLLDVQIPERNQGHWNSISTVLSDVSDVQAIETSVFHPFLYYKGTFDCVAKYKNTLCIFDWKTSDKPKPLLSNLYDNPLQVAAYLGALNACPDFTAKFGSVEHAAIVVAYTNGESAHVHKMSPAICQHYWAQWCQRLHQYWGMVLTEKVPSEALVKDLMTSTQ